jgi:hypothetical protein
LLWRIPVFSKPSPGVISSSAPGFSLSHSATYLEVTSMGRKSKKGGKKGNKGKGAKK